MAYQTIIVETKGRVGIVRLNRPDALNALNAQVIEELAAALDGFEADDGIGCIVITGNEKAFAAGADIKEMQSKTYMSAFKRTSSPVGTASPACANRSWRPSPVSRLAVAASSP